LDFIKSKAITRRQTRRFNRRKRRDAIKQQQQSSTCISLDNEIARVDQRLQYYRESTHQLDSDIFSFINHKFANDQSSTTTNVDDNSNRRTLKSDTTAMLNIKLFKLDEDIKRIDKQLEHYRESTSRNAIKDAVTANRMRSMGDDAGRQRDELMRKRKTIANEMNDRCDRKKNARF
jgi:hypothetical protein